MPAYRTLLLVTVLILPGLFSAQNNTGREKAFGNDWLFQEDQEGQQVSITNLSELSFGAFYPGKSGGTIEISADGFRTANGSVVLLHSEQQTSAAVFEIKCPSNTMVQIMVDPQIELKGESGETILCEPILPGEAHFISPENAESGFLYSIGAKLTVPEATIESSYSYFARIHVFLILE